MFTVTWINLNTLSVCFTCFSRCFAVPKYGIEKENLIPIARWSDHAFGIPNTWGRRRRVVSKRETVQGNQPLHSHACQRCWLTDRGPINIHIWMNWTIRTKKNHLRSQQEHVQEVLNKWTQIDDEIWAKVIIFEKNRRVAKAYARAPVLTINGSEDGFDGMR